jgi:hypothetical protein
MPACPATAGSLPGALASAGAATALPRTTISTSGAPPSTLNAPSLPALDMGAMEVGPADLRLPSAGPATFGLAPAALAGAGAAHATCVELPASMATAAPVSAMEARASLGILAAGTAHMQPFHTLLHDRSALLSAAAAVGDLVLTNSAVLWDQVSQRVKIAIWYRVVGGGAASPDTLLHIPQLLAQMARHFGLWPHDTTMAPDMPLVSDDAACC